MTTKEFNQKIKRGEAKMLTLDLAKQLKGQTIIWSYYSDSNCQQSIYETTVGDIVTKLDYYDHQPCEGWPSRAAEWRSRLSSEKLKEIQDTLMLLDDRGQETYLRCHINIHLYDEPTFTCSDSDREVYFIIK